MVLERRPVVGGAAITEELFPGYKFSRASYLCSLFRPQIIKDLKLKEVAHPSNLLANKLASTFSLHCVLHVAIALDACSLLFLLSQKYGLKLYHRNPSSFTPLRDGRYLLMGGTMQQNQQEIAKVWHIHSHFFCRLLCLPINFSAQVL